MSEPVNEIVDLPSAEARARQPRPRFGGRALIVCDNLVKIYKVADLEVVALQGLDLLVESGEFIAIVGDAMTSEVDQQAVIGIEALGKLLGEEGGEALTGYVFGERLDLVALLLGQNGR